MVVEELAGLLEWAAPADKQVRHPVAPELEACLEASLVVEDLAAAAMDRHKIYNRNAIKESSR